MRYALAIAGAVGAAILIGAGRSGASPLTRSSARVWPVQPKRGIISQFGVSRANGTRLHAGADLGAAPGDAIVALADGVVLYPVSGFGIYGDNPPAGYVPLQAVAIRHGDVELIYAEIMVEVSPGQTVKAGQRIGRAAKNGDGNSMLHLEAWKQAPHGFTPWTPEAKPAGLLNINDYLAGL